MSDVITPQDLVSRMIEASNQLDSAQDALIEAVKKASETERTYRMAKSTAYISSSGTVGEREAHVTKACDREAYEAHLSEGLAKAALEAVRNRRQVLSAYQSIANSVREEAALARTGTGY